MNYVQPVAPRRASAYDQRLATCQMIREYQTKVIVGDKTVDAYGDACLKPDGSWERGPAKLVPPEHVR